METKIDLLEKFALITSIMPYYGYAYDSVKLLKSLSKKTRKIYEDNSKGVINSLIKQLLVPYGNFSDITYNVLARGEKYKVFKIDFNIQLKTNPNYEVLLRILEEMPELEFNRIHFDLDEIIVDLNEEVVKMVNQLTDAIRHHIGDEDEFRKRYKISCSDSKLPSTVNLSYISTICGNLDSVNPNFEGTTLMELVSVKEESNYDFPVEQLGIRGSAIEKLAEYRLGTNKYLDSVKLVTLKYFEKSVKEKFDNDAKIIEAKFTNLDRLQVNNYYHSSKPLEDALAVLKHDKVKGIDFSGHGSKVYFSIKFPKGVVLLASNLEQKIIECSDVTIQVNTENVESFDDFIVFKEDSINLKLSIDEILYEHDYYSTFGTATLNEASLIVHKSYFEEVYIRNTSKINFNIVPKSRLHLYMTDHSDQMPDILKYLSSSIPNTVTVFLELIECLNVNQEQFNELVSTVFDNLNLQRIFVSKISDKINVDDLLDRISNSKTLRKVDLEIDQKPDVQLTLMDKDNSIKQWTLGLLSKKTWKDYQQQLVDLGLAHRDNSLVIRDSDGVLRGFNHLEQQFDTFPV